MLSVFLLSAAGFTVLTTEFIIVGLLPSIARDLQVTIAQAGLLVTLFAFTVAAFGPFLTAWFARFERRKLFISVLVMFGLANTLAALAPNRRNGRRPIDPSLGATGVLGIGQRNGSGHCRAAVCRAGHRPDRVRHCLCHGVRYSGRHADF